MGTWAKPTIGPGRLFVLAVGKNALGVLLIFTADHKQTLSKCGVSVTTAGKHTPSPVKKLIENGCDPNGRNAEGNMLLHLTGDSTSYAGTLLALGSQIDIVDNDSEQWHQCQPRHQAISEIASRGAPQGQVTHSCNSQYRKSTGVDTNEAPWGSRAVITVGKRDSVISP